MSDNIETPTSTDGTSNFQSYKEDAVGRVMDRRGFVHGVCRNGNQQPELLPRPNPQGIGLQQNNI